MQGKKIDLINIVRRFRKLSLLIFNFLFHLFSGQIIFDID